MQVIGCVNLLVQVRDSVNLLVQVIGSVNLLVHVIGCVNLPVQVIINGAERRPLRFCPVPGSRAGSSEA